MPFPDSPRTVFKTNPLREVVCQVRFSPILRIDSEAPAVFQEAIRAEYPDYDKAGTEVPPVPAEVVDLLPEAARAAFGLGSLRHRFITADGSKVLVLSSNSLALSERKYTTWENYRARLAEVRGRFESLYKPSPYTRLGLRYINVVDRKALGLGGVDWAELLHPAVLGLLAGPCAIEEFSQLSGVAHLAVPETEGGRVRIHHGLVRSDDGLDADKFVLDVDLYTEQPRRSNDVSDTLDRLYGTSGRIFRWAITPRLRDVLGPAEL